MMNGQMKQRLLLLQLITLFFPCHKCYSSLVNGRVNYDAATDPLYPFGVPSPLTPFTDISAPKLSGRCTLNFSSFESIVQTTATDCWSPLAPYLANVVCCPQYEALLDIVVGQSSLRSRKLSSDISPATDCVSDVEKILASQGANKNLHKICSVYPSNFTESACPVIEVGEIENIIDFSMILVACEDIDPTTECCNQVCGNAISTAAEKLNFQFRNHSSLSSHVPRLLSENSTSFYTCKQVVLRWLGSKLHPSAANKIFRGLSSCKVNKACPLVFPNIKNVSEECGNVISNHTSCCLAVESYMSHLHQQSFITNIQALSCATRLGSMLQNANVSRNIYDLCLINLEDFSVQVDSKEGCLLPSMPLDVTYDNTSGIGFMCDLNDNVRAPWSSASIITFSNCNTTGTADNSSIPEVPKAISNQHGIFVKETKMCLLLASLFTCIALLL